MVPLYPVLAHFTVVFPPISIHGTVKMDLATKYYMLERRLHDDINSCLSGSTLPAIGTWESQDVFLIIVQHRDDRLTNHVHTNGQA